ncbi:MAG: VWA domain-containing protein [Candidatus Coatesbacteria bacterium]|nr:MAG: VWA domain-containing protein [Candidatus Coatesbacteria bacterium]
MKRALILLAAGFGALLPLLPSTATADGIIIIYPLPPYPRPEPQIERYSLNIEYHRVRTVIDGQIATTQVDERFENPYDFDVEGVYIFPLPKGAAVDRFSLKVDGKPVEGEMLDADEAALEYRRLINQNKDPALLEYLGRGAVKARIYPIPAKGKKRVEIAYSEFLPYDGGLVKFVYPLDTERFSREPIEDVDVQVEINTERPLANVFSPSHEIKLERKAPNRTTVKYHVTDAKPAQDFVLYYGVGEVEFGASVLAHREPGEDGYALLTVTPPPAAPAPAEPKELLFVVDVSGSMAGDKIEQVKEAVSYCLRQLGPADRFNIISFNERPTLFREATVPATSDNVAAASEFVKKLTAGGGTNINAALLQSLASAAAEPVGPTMVVFLTDGKPTVDERNVPDIVANVIAANEDLNARLFSFGVGYKVKAELLDGLSRRNGGTAQYVEPGEDLELAVTSFYDKIAKPVLADVELEWENVEVYDPYPASVPDIFAGTQLTVFARYRDEGPEATLTLSGVRAGKTERYSYRLAGIAAESRDHPFVPALWATRKIGFLLEQIKLEGEDAELIETIVELSKRYGIPTPYTSYLAKDTGPAIGKPSPTVWDGVAGRGFSLESAGAAAEWMGSGLGAPAPASADELSVRESKAIGGMKRAEVARSAYGEGEAARYVGGKTFRLAAGVWRDVQLDDGPGGPEVAVKFASEEYFALIQKHPGLAPYFSLGEQVAVRFEGVTYRVRL